MNNKSAWLNSKVPTTLFFGQRVQEETGSDSADDSARYKKVEEKKRLPESSGAYSSKYTIREFSNVNTTQPETYISKGSEKVREHVEAEGVKPATDAKANKESHSAKAHHLDSKHKELKEKPSSSEPSGSFSFKKCFSGQKSKKGSPEASSSTHNKNLEENELPFYETSLKKVSLLTRRVNEGEKALKTFASRLAERADNKKRRWFFNVLKHRQSLQAIMPEEGNKKIKKEEGIKEKHSVKGDVKLAGKDEAQKTFSLSAQKVTGVAQADDHSIFKTVKERLGYQFKDQDLLLNALIYHNFAESETNTEAMGYDQLRSFLWQYFQEKYKWASYNQKKVWTDQYTDNKVLAMYSQYLSLGEATIPKCNNKKKEAKKEAENRRSSDHVSSTMLVTLLGAIHGDLQKQGKDDDLRKIISHLLMGGESGNEGIQEIKKAKEELDALCKDIKWKKPTLKAMFTNSSGKEGGDLCFAFVKSGKRLIGIGHGRTSDDAKCHAIFCTKQLLQPILVNNLQQRSYDQSVQAPTI